jgi:hypothetical protein
MPRKVQRYGWVPDIPDPRDFLFAAPPEVLLNLPTKVDLRPQCPPIYDQGQLGSCTANAIAAAFEFEQGKTNLQDFLPSRLFIYYNERAVEGTTNQDSGARIRDGIKSVVKQGVCPETEWPYTTNMSTVTEKPPAPDYTDALQNKVIAYHKVTQNLNQMKGCLACGSHKDQYAPRKPFCHIHRRSAQIFLTGAPTQGGLFHESGVLGRWSFSA